MLTGIFHGETIDFLQKRRASACFFMCTGGMSGSDLSGQAAGDIVYFEEFWQITWKITPKSIIIRYKAVTIFHR